jgi:chlorophyllide a reductase subunit X
MNTHAIVLEKPETIALRDVGLTAPQPGDAVVDVLWSGISTGTEKMLWDGTMPTFPGMGYPLVPGYEGVGRVREVTDGCALSEGQLVFVPGARCYEDVHPLFGASAARVVVGGKKVYPVSETLGRDAVLLALAATAHHALTLPGVALKETQIIAIYGKGGIGKSFTLANLSYMMAQQGKRVLLIGCDPKSDTTSLLFGGRSCPTIIETSTKKEARRARKSAIGDVCFKRDGVFAMELGGPEVGRGCGGRGIIHGFELLEKLGFHDWDFDYVLLDFLGDVVCGGFGLPIARDMCQKVIVVGSNDLQSLYVANNVCSAVEYFRKMGGNVGVAGMVINKDDGTGEAASLCRSGRHPGAAAIPADEDIRRKSANYQIIGTPGGSLGALFEQLAENIAEAPPQQPEPLTQDGLLGLFSPKKPVATSSHPRLRKICAAEVARRSRRSKSFTTRSEMAGTHHLMIRNPTDAQRTT